MHSLIQITVVNRSQSDVAGFLDVAAGMLQVSAAVLSAFRSPAAVLGAKARRHVHLNSSTTWGRLLSYHVLALLVLGMHKLIWHLHLSVAFCCQGLDCSCQPIASVLLQDASQAPGHVRSVSLGSSASQFLQSLKLQDPAALQHSLQGPADQFALPDQHTPHAACAGADASTAAAQDRGAGQPARSKRTHRSSNGRASKDAMQLDSMGLEQQSHGFTPLPAVVENSPLDSER